MSPSVNKYAHTTLYVMDEWRETAVSEFYDIEGWREHAEERPYSGPSRGWSEMDQRFYGQTSYLVGWITAHHKHLDPAPLTIIYDAVNAWHRDHNDKQVPSPHELQDALEKACILLTALDMAILPLGGVDAVMVGPFTTKGCASYWNVSENTIRAWAKGESCPMGVTIKNAGTRGRWYTSRNEAQ